MEPLFYMEYRETKKFVEEAAQAFYKYRNTKRLKMFQTVDIKTKSIDKTAEIFEDLKKTTRKDRLVKVEFYEEQLNFEVGTDKREIGYKNIEKIFETDTVLALYNNAGKKKEEKFLTLKKGSIRGRSLAELKSFLLEKCENAKGEIIAL